MILITGATGFIGGRITERLFLEHGIRARCLVRTYGHVARIARFPVELVRGDVLDAASLEAAVAGCDVVVHCAYGNTGDDATNVRINTEGTDQLADRAVRCGVRRFIHLSTVEVYGDERPPVADENTPLSASRESYGRSKQRAEQICLEYSRRRGLPAVILRPTVVYGPYAPFWTVGIVDRLRNGGIVLSESSEGTCNPLYADDLVDAILLATEQEGAVGEVFNISSGERCTWNEYFRRLNDLLGQPPLVWEGGLTLRRYQAVRRVLKPALALVQRWYGPRAVALYQRLREVGKLPNLKGWMQRGGLMEDANIFGARTYYPIDKARARLGFKPRHDLTAGLAKVRSWLAHIGVIA